MADQSPGPWRLAWRVATSNWLLVALLLAVALSVTLTGWIPQHPSSDAGYARWLSQAQARFGDATSAMQALGLFRIVASPGFCVLLALLSGCLVLHFVEGFERLQHGREIEEPQGEWRDIPGREISTLLEDLRRRRYRVVNASSFFQVDRWPLSGIVPLTTLVGLLLLLISLLLSNLMGWRAEGLVLQDAERQSLPGVDNWVTLSGDVGDVQHSRGVVAFIEERGPGVQVSAVGEDGERLDLLLTPEAEPSGSLRIALTEDTYFAIPEAELVVRVTPRSVEPFTGVDVQLFSSPTGQIISEKLTEEGGEATFEVSGVTLSFVPEPYARVMATHNPGRLVAGVGVLTLMAGVMMGLGWSEHRFWLRETGTSVEAAGVIPTRLQRGEES